MANAYRRTPFDWRPTLSFGMSNFECEIAEGMICVNRTLNVGLSDKIGQRGKKCPTLTLTDEEERTESFSQPPPHLE